MEIEKFVSSKEVKSEVSNRWLSFFLFLAVAAFPSSVFAEENNEDSAQPGTDAVQKTVNERIVSDKNVGVSEVNSTPVEAQEEATTESASPDPAILKVEVPILHAEISVSAQSIKVKAAEIEAEVTPTAPAVKVSSPVVNAEASVESSAAKVAAPIAKADVSLREPSVQVETPVLEASVAADQPAIKVATPVAKADISIEKLGVRVHTPVLKGEVSLDDPAIKVATPIAEADVALKDLGVQVRTPILQAEVLGNSPGIKAATPIAEVDVSLEDLGVQVRTPVLNADLSVKNPGVKVHTPVPSTVVPGDKEHDKELPPIKEAEEVAQAPAVQEQQLSTNVGTGPKSPSDKADAPTANLELPQEQTEVPISPFWPALSDDKDQVTNEVPDIKKEPQSLIAPMLISKSANDKVKENTESAKEQSSDKSWEQRAPSLDFTGKANTKDEAATSRIAENVNQIAPGVQPASPTIFYNGQGSCGTSISSTGGSLVIGIPANIHLSEYSISNKMMEETKLLYDQWQNAPPNQPPQVAFFLQNFNYHV